MKKVGWIGTGVMGNAMVQHIIKAGYEVHVWNRTQSKTKNLASLWAIIEDSVADVVQKSDIIFTIIWNPQNVRDTYFWGGGIIENISDDKIIVDMTTTEPKLAKEIYASHSQSLDAPVSGGDVGAINGTLSIMVGWDSPVFEEILPLFELMWGSITHTGDAGSWQHTKMANQIGIAGNTIAICEAMVYAEKAGLDIHKTIEVVSNGAAGSWGWKNLAPRITAWELDTCFFVKHFVKDLKIALDEAREMKLSLPGLALVHQLYMSLVAYDEEDLWTQALITVIKKINNM